MTRLLEPLTADQQKLIELIAETYHTYDGQAPVWEYLELEFDRLQRDARATLDSLPRVGGPAHTSRQYGLVWYDQRIPANDTRVQLTVAGRHHVGGAIETDHLEDFIIILKRLTQARREYRMSPIEAQSAYINQRELTHMIGGLNKSKATIFRRTAAYEPLFMGSINDAENPEDGWKLQLRRELVLYDGIETWEDYINKVAELLTPPALTAEPAVLSPLGLVSAFDYLNVVWQLHFEKPLVQPLNGERTARLAFDVTTTDELNAQVSSVAEIIKTLSVSGDPTVNKTAVSRLTPFINSKKYVDSTSIQRIEEAVEVLKAVQSVRNSLWQHSGTEHRGVAAVKLLGLSYPITDAAIAWRSIQKKIIDALTALREEIQAAPSI
jgi:hypothetical protein